MKANNEEMFLPTKVDLFSDNLLLEDRELSLVKRFSDYRMSFTNVKVLKIFFTLVSLFNESQAFEQYKFSISALCTYLNMKYDKSNRELRKILEKFKQAEIYLPKEPGESDKERESRHVLSGCKISDSKEFVYLKLNSDLIDTFLFNGSTGYIRSLMTAIIDMAYADSLLFYIELRKNYWTKPNGKIKKNIFDLTVSEFRDICQISEKTYSNEGNVRRNILNRIQKDISENSDLTFTYELIKASTRGNPIIGYRFIVGKNENFSIAKKRLKPLEKMKVGFEKLKDDIIAARKSGFSKIFDELANLGYAEIGLGEIARSKLQPADVANIIQLSQKSNVENKAAYIRTSIQNKIEMIAAIEEADEEMAAVEEKRQKDQLEEEEKEKSNSIKFLEYIRKSILALSEEKIDALLTDLNKKTNISKVSKEDLFSFKDTEETEDTIIKTLKFQLVKKYIVDNNMMQ